MHMHMYMYVMPLLTFVLVILFCQQVCVYTLIVTVCIHVHAPVACSGHAL